MSVRTIGYIDRRKYETLNVIESVCFLDISLRGLRVASYAARAAFHGAAATKRADYEMARDILDELGMSPGPEPDVILEIDTEAPAKSPTKKPRKRHGNKEERLAISESGQFEHVADIVM